MPSVVEDAQKDMVAHWPDVAKTWSLLKINVYSCSASFRNLSTADFSAAVLGSVLRLIISSCTTALPSRSRIIDAYAAILHSTLDVFLSKEERRCLLPFPSLTRVSLCMGLRTKTFLFFYGTYDMMLQSLGKANLEDFNSLLMVALACFFSVATKVKFSFLSSTPSSLFCREPLTCLGSSREFHLTACQCKFAYSMSSLTLGNRLPNT
ncbi:hypothetical protein T4E_1867 [Trichinella pseudospiralis]|uniref:Uncharacterized protein n=1 Tax=Trichinella pseudospiralis TaxID=6337 RepID=A0A0V0XI15_TRIPS|nr:hypothetical protein T4E_1867 [Trichinella pseudospiralis]